MTTFRRPWYELAPLPVDGRPPPANLEHEAIVNAAVLVERGFLERVSPPLLPEHFASAERRIVFETAQEVHRETGAVNVVAVHDRLKASGRLAQIADVAQFQVAAHLINSKASLTPGEVEQAVAAAGNVHALAQRRRLALLCQQALGAIYADRIESPRSFFESFEAQVSEVCRAALRGSSTTSAASGVKAALTDIFDPKADSGPPSGLANYDAALSLKPGEYTVLGGSTGNGKTALGLTIAGNVATRGDGVLYVAAADMKAPELMLRLVCSWANVWASRVRRKQCSPAQFEAITRAVARFDRLPLHIDDAHGQTIQEIDAQTRRTAILCEREYRTKLRLVVVDYIQACAFLGASPRQSEEQVLKAISKHAKQIASKHRVHVIGLVQTWPVQANAKDGGDGKPDLQHIKGCKAIAHEAENVGFIHRYKENGQYPIRGRAEIVVRKSRWGGTGEIPLIFDGPLTRFEDDPDAPEQDRGAA